MCYVNSLFVYTKLFSIMILSADSTCNIYSECGDCITSGEHCLWCKQKVYNGPRCAEEVELIASGCDVCNIIEQPNSTSTIVEDKPLSNGNQGVGTVQLQPQQLDIKLVPLVPCRFTIKYKVAENVPVDIYFLVDPSYTMRFLVDALADKALEIVETLESFSDDIQIGYGTSVDKVILPFAHTTDVYLQNPCPTATHTCESPYSFRHRLALTSNISDFRNAFDKTNISANRDKLEGMLDGLMQATVCTAEIGWRSNARKIVFYVSDSSFKFAGDGKLAGIVTPHDSRCHLSHDNGYQKYTHDTVLDNPSIGQITETVIKNNINVVFLISSFFGAVNDYATLNLPGSFAYEIDPAAENIVSAITQSYKMLQESVTFLHDQVKRIDVQYKTDCNGRHSYGTRNSCDNIAADEVIDFDVWINLTQCPDDTSELNQTIWLRPIGIGEQIEVNLEYVCKCECQETGFIINSTKCNNNGRLECGVCYCNDDFTGDFCECDLHRNMSDIELCGKIINDNPIVCSNVGECRCGRCYCPASYTGAYCECDNRACGGFISTGELCNGKGVCECGICQCRSDFTGSLCECPVSNNSCRYNSTICSGHGQCVCGRCACDKYHSGLYCQDCTICNGCEINKDCAVCVAFSKGPLNTDECRRQCSHVTKSEQLHVGGTMIKCQTEDIDGCWMEFTFVDEGDLKKKVEVKPTRICPPVSTKPNFTSYYFGWPFGILGLGLLILFAWKGIIMCMEKYEHRRVDCTNDEEELRQPGNSQQELRTSASQEEMPGTNNSTNHGLGENISTSREQNEITTEFVGPADSAVVQGSNTGSTNYDFGDHTNTSGEQNGLTTEFVDPDDSAVYGYNSYNG